jgi:hypothetical protein
MTDRATTSRCMGSLRRFVALVALATASACDAPPGSAIYGCTTSVAGVLQTKYACRLSMAPLPAAGYVFFHDNTALGSRSAYTAAVEIRGSLTVARGAAALRMLAEDGAVQTYHASAGQPSEFHLTARTTMRTDTRGLEFRLTPEGTPPMADSVRMEFTYTH